MLSCCAFRPRLCGSPQTCPAAQRTCPLARKTRHGVAAATLGLEAFPPLLLLSSHLRAVTWDCSRGLGLSCAPSLVLPLPAGPADPQPPCWVSTQPRGGPPWDAGKGPVTPAGRGSLNFLAAHRLVRTMSAGQWGRVLTTVDICRAGSSHGRLMAICPYLGFPTFPHGRPWALNEQIEVKVI